MNLQTEECRCFRAVLRLTDLIYEKKKYCNFGHIIKPKGKTTLSFQSKGVELECAGGLQSV